MSLPNWKKFDNTLICKAYDTLVNKEKNPQFKQDIEHFISLLCPIANTPNSELYISESGDVEYFLKLCFIPLNASDSSSPEEKLELTITIAPELIGDNTNAGEIIIQDQTSIYKVLGLYFIDHPKSIILLSLNDEYPMELWLGESDDKKNDTGGCIPTKFDRMSFSHYIELSLAGAKKFRIVLRK